LPDHTIKTLLIKKCVPGGIIVRIIIVGGGELVFFLARTYLSKGYKVSVVNRHRDECEQLAKALEKVMIICGDGTDPHFLEDAHAAEAQLLLAVTPKDYINLVCCQTGALKFSIPRTLALINDPDNYNLYKEFGISHVFNQTELMVSMLERNVTYDYLSHLATFGDGEVFINEIHVNEKMPVVGGTIGEINLPHSARIIGIERNKSFELAVRDSIIQDGDRLVILTTAENHAPTLRVIAGEEV
jgi:trk system potassium uptake protein